jgi:D-alanine-D-alanine ligase
VVFLALHGKGGEDGTIQAMLEWRGIPFTGPGSKASALCMDKLRTRQVFDQVGVPGPDWFRLRNDESVRNKKGFDRLVVKPRSEGSSLGMSIVEESNLDEAVREARKFDSDIIVEEYVPGYELTVGVFAGDELQVLPPVGIRPEHEFFDYDTKYTKGLTEYDVPAELDSEQTEALESMTREVVREAGTEALCRVDYILGDDGEFQLLEINTIPGLTETSLLPKAASEAGIPFENLLWTLVKTAWRDRQCRPT